VCSRARSVAFVAVLLAPSLGVPAVARADGGTEPAAEHFRHGVALYKDGDYAGALVEFRRAQDISPNYRVLYDIGQSLYQLQRYAEALEDDLTNGREKVAARTREGLAYEKAFSEASTLLLNHLKAKPEARDLLQELVTVMHGQQPVKSESRTP